VLERHEAKKADLGKTLAVIRDGCHGCFVIFAFVLFGIGVLCIRTAFSEAESESIQSSEIAQQTSSSSEFEQHPLVVQQTNSPTLMSGVTRVICGIVGLGSSILGLVLLLSVLFQTKDCKHDGKSKERKRTKLRETE
jgi:hypothetical protein